MNGLRTLASLGAAALLIGILAWPLLFTNASFNEDWLNHLWYIWHQSLALRADHAPGLFLNYSRNVFYPLYAFYGGTIYALTATLTLLLGDAPLAAYILTYLLGFAAAYGGFFWIARSFGLGRWQAQLPGLVFVTSASYLTSIYARGDWPEFIGVSMMPLMAAAGLAIVRAERLRLWPALALVASTVVFFGSHNITIVWGSTFMVLTGLAIVTFVPDARRAISRRRALRLAVLVVPALLVNAWFLLPTAAYESHTVIANAYPQWQRSVHKTMYVVSVKNIFTLSRARASGTVLTVALPILAIAWVLAGIAIFLAAGLRGTWLRVLLVVCGATLLIGVAMTHAAIVLALPRLYSTLQFSFRLESYVLLGVAGAVLAALVLARRGGRRVRLWAWALLPIAIVSIVGAVQQVDAYPSGEGRRVSLQSYLPPRPDGLIAYVDTSLAYLEKRLPVVDFHPAPAQADRVSAVVHLPPGQLVDTNIRAGPNLVHVTGARIVGNDPEADDVLEIAPRGRAAARSRPPAGSRPSTRSRPPAATVTISVSPADSLPVVLGRVLTLLAITVLAVELAVLATRGRRRSRGTGRGRDRAQGRGRARGRGRAQGDGR